MEQKETNVSKRQKDLHSYYLRLRRRVQAGLFVGFTIPMLILSAYFHFQFVKSIRETTERHFVILAESRRNTIDLFLQERIVNVFSLFHSADFSPAPSPEDMKRHLMQLKGFSGAFVDVAFLDGTTGRQTGYAGPFKNLLGRDYSHEKWFATVMREGRSFHITDVYLGFRNKPHFTIAVKQLIQGKPYVMRATIDPDEFYHHLETIRKSDEVESYLINGVGEYQTASRSRIKTGKSDFIPAEKKETGAALVNTKGGSDLVAYARLEQAPWIMIVRGPTVKAYAAMRRSRLILAAITLTMVSILGVVIWITTERLLKRAEHVEEVQDELKSQLVHASKLMSIGELAAGVAHEINNPLAIISSLAGLLKDMYNPEFGMEVSREEIVEELNNIDTAVFRARDITRKLLNFARKQESELAPTSLSTAFEEVVSGLLEKELEISNIALVRDYDPHLPKVMLDCDHLRQVFLNFLNNARDAITPPGKITLSTRSADGFVYATVSDTGKGITPEQMKRIFMPFFTTKEVGKGTGLGLSISLAIVHAMAGEVEVESVPGKGTSFTTKFPLSANMEVEGSA